MKGIDHLKSRIASESKIVHPGQVNQHIKSERPIVAQKFANIINGRFIDHNDGIVAIRVSIKY